VAAGFVLGPGIAISAENTATVNPLLTEKWNIWVGGFFPTMDSRLRVDSDIGTPGDELDLEEQLGLDDNKSALWGGASWRFAPRHRLETEFANLRRTGFTAGTAEDYQIGDYIVDGGGAILTTFNVAILRLTYGFSVIKDDRQDLSLKAGVHLMRTEASLQLGIEGTVRDAEDNTQIVCEPANPCITPLLETDEFTFPLPHLGLSYAYAFTPKLALRTQLLGFYLEVNDIQGELLEFDFDLIYRPWEHVGLGFGARVFHAGLDDNKDKLFNGKFEYNYWGPVIYGIFTF
jgi:hypothetical protein